MLISFLEFNILLLFSTFLSLLNVFMECMYNDQSLYLVVVFLNIYVINKFADYDLKMT